jgi:hypothetical protein
MEDRKAAELRWIEEADQRERSARRLPTLGELLRSSETQPTAPLGGTRRVSWPGGRTPTFATHRRVGRSVEGLG